jgi:hypothetical protein
VPGRRRERGLVAGWTDAELPEAFAHVAVNLYTNYVNHLAHADLDVAPAPGLEA